MSSNQPNSFTCFDGNRRVISGSLQVIALALKKVLSGGTTNSVLVFDNATGRTIDIDIRGTDDEVLMRLAAPGEPHVGAEVDRPPSSSCEPVCNEGRGRGRPKLGVIAKEVTLLPRHWEWLGEQPGGASVALRKLVEEARRAGSERDRIRKAHERAYHFMSAIAGDLPNYEEATRALFAHDLNKFSDLMVSWPGDIRDYAVFLGFGAGPYSAAVNECA